MTTAMAMEASSVLRSSSSSSSYSIVSSSPKQPQFVLSFNLRPCCFPKKCPFLAFFPQTRAFRRHNSILRASTSAIVVGEEVSSGSAFSSSSSSSSPELMPKIDKSGRFCSPRAARELALSILYAACLEGSDPLRLFEKRMNVRREPGFLFDKTLLTKYNQMSFAGPPVTVDTVEEADELIRKDNEESEIEVEVLSAPPKLVYSKLILRLTRKLLVAVVDRWNSHVLVIDKVAPSNWKNKPAGRILELCILHMAMSEISVVGTRHQIVINEAVDLAKRFCDGAAPRVINGCLGTFVKDVGENGIIALGSENKQALLS
ncbi:uncharacterized protein LOC127806537 [Diospyros lotus]|uniref:uncharacterized protein LOC127806537 n=1 Tax=Diospyros lotus TaxID=55363 RepID=UPI002253BDFB|nr:uncharacterized protein LOC127806537 [Diospyros lotus]